jgi:hypothetical protein
VEDELIGDDDVSGCVLIYKGVICGRVIGRILLWWLGKPTRCIVERYRTMSTESCSGRFSRVWLFVVALVETGERSYKGIFGRYIQDIEGLPY